MSPQARMLLVMTVLALVGVVALGTMARRYTAMFEQTASAEPSTEGSASSRRAFPDTESARQRRFKLAERNVDAFLRVRSSLHAVREQLVDAGGGERGAAFSRMRNRALTEAGLDVARYVEIREAYRVWQGGGDVGEPLARAFADRRERLEGMNLGELEALDR